MKTEDRLTLDDTPAPAPAPAGPYVAPPIPYRPVAPQPPPPVADPWADRRPAATDPAAPKSPASSYLAPVLIALALLATAANIGYVAWIHLHAPAPAPGPAPAPAPTPATALAEATKAYLATLPAHYGAVADQVQTGAIHDQAGLLKALADHGKPVSDALKASAQPMMDDKGVITNPTGLANVLRQTGTYLGGGR